MAYTDTTKIANYLGRALTAKESSLCTLLIPAIKRYIDAKSSMTFEKVTDSASPDYTGGTRYFEGDGGQILFLEDCVVRSITAINEVDSDGQVTSTVDPDNFEAFPLNKPAKRYIKLSSSNDRWYKGVKSVSIAGEFSFSDSAPDDIQLVATIMAAELMRNPQQLSSESIEGYSRTFSDVTKDHPEIDLTISHYARIKV